MYKKLTIFFFTIIALSGSIECSKDKCRRLTLEEILIKAEGQSFADIYDMVSRRSKRDKSSFLRRLRRKEHSVTTRKVIRALQTTSENVKQFVQIEEQEQSRKAKQEFDRKYPKETHQYYRTLKNSGELYLDKDGLPMDGDPLVQMHKYFLTNPDGTLQRNEDGDTLLPFYTDRVEMFWMDCPKNSKKKKKAGREIQDFAREQKEDND